MMRSGNTKKRMVAHSTRLDKSTLAQLRGIAQDENCAVSVLVRKAVDLLDQAYQKPVLPEYLTQLVPSPKNPVVITFRIGALQSQRLKILATNRNQSASYLLRAAVHYFIVLYQGPEFGDSIMQSLMPSGRVPIPLVDTELMENVTRVALERNEPLHIVTSDALSLYVNFHDSTMLTKGIRETLAFMNYLALVLPLREGQSETTLEEAVRRHVGGTQNKTEDSGKVSATREEKEDESREKAPEQG